MDKNQKQKGQARVGKIPNPLEALKDIGTQTAKNFREDLVEKMPQDFMDQLFGPQPSSKRYSGEITAGESVELNEVYSGKFEDNQKIRHQLSLEKRLLQEERSRVERKTNELRMQLKLVMDEIMKLAVSSQKLAEEAKIASMQAPVEPGIYHVLFFEKLLEFLQSFRKKVDEAGIWLSSVNKRASRKNAWGANYKKHGGKYLLSGEHYLQRSAG